MFRPFVGEILSGKLHECDGKGLRLSLGFFKDITVPVHLLPTPSKFVDGKWIWSYEGIEMAIEQSEEIRFRVHSVQYPPIPVEQEKDSKPFAPMAITVLVEYKNKDLNHVEWAKAMKELYLPGLRDYVKNYHPLGPAWNPSGVSVPSSKVDISHLFLIIPIGPQVEKDKLLLKIEAARKGKSWDDVDVGDENQDCGLVKTYVSKIQELEAQLLRLQSLSDTKRNDFADCLDLEDETLHPRSEYASTLNGLKEGENPGKNERDSARCTYGTISWMAGGEDALA